MRNLISFRVAVFWFCCVASGEGIHAQEVVTSIHHTELAAHRHVVPVALNKPGEMIQPLQPRASILSGEVYGYLPYWSTSAYLDYSLLTTIAYFGVEFDANGNVVARHGWPNKGLINLAHSRGVRIELVIMGYDYYWSGSTTSGPVASLSGGTYNVTRTVSDYVTETGLPHKLILGCPYYGYEWPTQTDQPLSTTLGTGSARVYDSAESNAQAYGSCGTALDRCRGIVSKLSIGTSVSMMTPPA